MLNGTVSKLNEVIKGELNFHQKKSLFNKKETDTFVKMELISGRVVLLRVNDKTILDLIRTLQECGMEKPIASFQIEELMGNSGTPYIAVVVRLKDKKQTIDQYMIPYKVQSILETLYDNKPKNEIKNKGV